MLVLALLNSGPNQLPYLESLNVFFFLLPIEEEIIDLTAKVKTLSSASESQQGTVYMKFPDPFPKKYPCSLSPQ